MRITLRGLALVFCSLVAVLPTTASAAEPSIPAACADGTQPSGAVYRICMPTQWNNKLVVYAHGYVAPNRPVAIPEEQMRLPGSTLTVDQVVTGQGYAFAASSYRTNGLAIPEGVADLVELVELFTQQQGEPAQVLLAGVSEGGQITALAVERHPQIFHGGLALCGPYGDFVAQVNYFGDFRVLFDYFFPGLIPGSAVDVPAELIDTWETGFYTDTVRPIITDPANAAAVEQLLAVTGAAFDPADPTSKERTIQNVLWYNIFATNDAIEKLGGQPYANQGRHYTGSANDEQLNQQVARFGADPAALAAIAADYETTGALAAPLITMHTTGDPVAPYFHATRYLFKTINADNIALHEQYGFARYGHCQFNPLEVLGGFGRLAAMVDDPPPYRPATRLHLPLLSSDVIVAR